MADYMNKTPSAVGNTSYLEQEIQRLSNEITQEDKTLETHIAKYREAGKALIDKRNHFRLKNHKIVQNNQTPPPGGKA